MRNKAPKLIVLQGGKKESSLSIKTEIAIIILGVLFLAMLLYKAA